MLGVISHNFAAFSKGEVTGAESCTKFRREAAGSSSVSRSVGSVEIPGVKGDTDHEGLACVGHF